MQANKPVREQSDATGHAVRAVYLYTGMAELAAESGDRELLEACKRLWDSITKRQMYITGGIGSTVIGEAVQYGLRPAFRYRLRRDLRRYRSYLFRKGNAKKRNGRKIRRYL